MTNEVDPWHASLAHFELLLKCKKGEEVDNSRRQFRLSERGGDHRVVAFKRDQSRVYSRVLMGFYDETPHFPLLFTLKNLFQARGCVLCLPATPPV